MILTKESLNKLLTDMWVRDVSAELCAKHEWTEQDIVEQIRKMLR